MKFVVEFPKQINMQLLLPFLFTLILSNSLFSQDLLEAANGISESKQKDVRTKENDENGHPVSRFSLSAGIPVLFQYGPTINAELGITGRLAFRAYIRLNSLNYLIASTPDGGTWSHLFDNATLGGGPILFFGPGQNKLYLGILVEYGRIESYNFDSGSHPLHTETITSSYMLSGGYRFRFEKGLFINVGGFAGFQNITSSWDLGDKNSNGSVCYGVKTHTSSEHKLFLAPEVSIGYEF
jgi:hypothetical protein